MLSVRASWLLLGVSLVSCGPALPASPPASDKARAPATASASATSAAVAAPSVDPFAAASADDGAAPEPPFDAFADLRLKTPVPSPLPAGAVLRLGTRAVTYLGAQTVAAHPTKELVVSFMYNELVLWDAATGLPKERLGSVECRDGCTHFDLLSDGNTLVIAGYREGVIFDIGKRTSTTFDYGGGSGYHPRGIERDEKGGFVVFGCGKGDAPVLRFDRTGKGTQTYGGLGRDLGEVCAGAAAVSADGRFVAAASSKELVLYRADSGAVAGRVALDYVNGVRFSADGKRLYAASSTAVNAFDTATMRASASFGFYEGSFDSPLALPNEGKTLAIASGQRLLGFDTATGDRLFATDADLTGRLVALRSGMLVTGSREPEGLARFDGATGKRLGPVDLGRHERDVLSIATSGDDWLTTAGDGDTRVFSAQGAPLATFAARPGGGRVRVRARAGTREAFSLFESCKLYRWDIDRRVILGKLVATQAQCRAEHFDVTPDGQRVVAPMGGAIVITDADLKVLGRVDLANKNETALAVQIDAAGARAHVVTASELITLDLKTLALVKRAPITEESVRAVVLAPEQSAAFFVTDEEIHVVDLATGKRTKTVAFKWDDGLVQSAALLPQKGEIALGGRDAVTIVDLERGGVLRKKTGFGSVNVTALAVNPKTGKLAAGGSDGNTLVWSL